MPSTSLLIAAPPVPPAAPSTGRALAFVYAGYLFRYVYLLILIPFYGRVLGAQEYGRVLAAMSLYQMVWMLTEYGFPLAGARDIAAAGNDTRRVGALYAQQMNARWLMAVPGLLLGVVGTLASPLLRETPLFGLLATANGLMAAFNLGWFYQGRLRFGTSVVFELIGFAINLPLILLSVHGPGDGARVLGALLASTIICTLAAHAYALRGIERVRAGWRESLALVRSSTALFAHKGVTLMMASSSTYLLSLFAPAGGRDAHHDVHRKILCSKPCFTRIASSTAASSTLPAQRAHATPSPPASGASTRIATSVASAPNRLLSETSVSRRSGIST